MFTRRMFAAFTLFALAALSGCSNSGGETAADGAASAGGTSGTTAASTPSTEPGGKTLRIAVVPKGTSHEFWKSIHAGANKAAEELKAEGQNVEIIWKGPAREDDRNAQIEVVETFVSQKVDGIVLAPMDAEALVRPVETAAKEKVPVVVIDSGLKSQEFVSYVATDNKKGGELAGEHLAKAMGEKGKVLMMRYLQGSASTEEREAGFLEAMKKYPGITVVSSDQFAGASVDNAMKTGQNLLSRYGKEVEGIFTSNESATRGMRLAMKEAGLLGKVKFVGFDSSPDLIEALKANELQGLVMQSPFKMGQLGVKTLVAAIKGDKVEKTVDTGVQLVTAENMDTPEMKELLNPPQAE